MDVLFSSLEILGWAREIVFLSNLQEKYVPTTVMVIIIEIWFFSKYPFSQSKLTLKEVKFLLRKWI